jgi:hypothetical protein
MQTKTGNRIVFIGRTIPTKKMTPYRQPVGCPRTASHRTVIIKDGEFVRSRARR